MLLDQHRGRTDQGGEQEAAGDQPLAPGDLLVGENGKEEGAGYGNVHGGHTVAGRGVHQVDEFHQPDGGIVSSQGFKVRPQFNGDAVGYEQAEGHGDANAQVDNGAGMQKALFAGHDRQHHGKDDVGKPEHIGNHKPFAEGDLQIQRAGEQEYLMTSKNQVGDSIGHELHRPVEKQI